jgi:LysR family transcriptional regulator, regulator for metE and metH
MIPRLDMKHLTVLVALAETGSVTATAARLALTQSAVSHRLREAERRLGVRLVERHERGVRLTAAAERLRVGASQWLRELVRIEGELREDTGVTVVRIGQATYSRYHWLPAFLQFVQSLEPALRIDLSGTATAKPFAALNSGLVDVVTVYGREMTTGRYRWRKLATDPLVAILAPGHRLAARPYLDAADIAAEHYFSYPLSAEPGFEWEALIGAPSVPFSQVTHMPTPEAVIDLVRAGFGVGVFSRWAVEPEVVDGTLLALPISPAGMALDWWAVTRADEGAGTPATRVAQAFVRWSARYETGLATLGFEQTQAVPSE